MKLTVLHRIGRLAGALLAAGGLAAGIGCGLSVVGSLDCTVENAKVRRISQDSFAELGYSYDFDCNSPEYTGTARGSYNRTTQRLEEVVENGNGKLIAVWTCPTDPFITGTVRCRLVEQQANYKGKAEYPDASRLPYGTWATFKLTEADRARFRRLVGELPPIPKQPKEQEQAPPPPPKPTKPDLQVTRVSGPTQLFDGQTAVYEVALWNDGTPARGTAQIQLGFTGGLEAWEMVDTPAGFTCTRALTGFSCTGSLGGVDDPIQTRSAVFKVQGHAKAKGTGSVYGSANHDRALDEVTVDNNLKLLNVTVK